MSDNQDDKNVDVQDDNNSTSDADVTKLLEKNQRLQGQLTDIEKKYNRFSSMYKDIDPDEYRSMKERLEEAEKKSADNNPEELEKIFQRKMDSLRAQAEQDKQSLQEELLNLKKINKTLAVTDRVMSEVSGLFNQDAVKFIKREVEESCDLDEDGNIVVKDENGDILYKGARPMTPKEYGDLLVEKYPSLAKATGVGGTQDATSRQKTGSRSSNRVPETYAELQAMPNAREVLERLKRENPAAVQKILRSISA